MDDEVVYVTPGLRCYHISQSCASRARNSTSWAESRRFAVGALGLPPCLRCGKNEPRPTPKEPVVSLSEAFVVQASIGVTDDYPHSGILGVGGTYPRALELITESGHTECKLNPVLQPCQELEGYGIRLTGYSHACDHYNIYRFRVPPLELQRSLPNQIDTVMVNLLDEGCTQGDIHRETGLSRAEISRRVTRYRGLGGTYKPKSPGPDKSGPRRTMVSVEIVRHLCITGEPHYGLEMAKVLGLDSGTIYPALARLHRAGLITRQREVGNPRDLGRRLRTYYRVADEQFDRAIDFVHGSGEYASR